MALTKNQIRDLRKMAQALKGQVQVGKSGITEGTLVNLNESLKAHELVKITVLKNATDNTKEVAQALAQATGADIVQVIGRQIVLFKRNPDNPVIQLAAI
ncbi:ribosome assembly RNA-binding protein YhbY [Peptococcus simiae]|uniref:Ribosome assembly RNA-binding protein YhbY n=1 Tax=Peptococcus simiae TaxID=1643805 RepID=A0ABW9GX52_9FIRM